MPSEMEDDDDEETQEWEMAQVRRAGGWKEEEPEKPAKASYQPTPSKYFLEFETAQLIFSANGSATTNDYTRPEPSCQFPRPA